jgi:REP element-mobilizing transposase RayT
MSEHIIRSHNKTLLLYHIVCPAKYRKAIFTEAVEQSLKEVCVEIGLRYEIHFVEIGTDEDHIHFLVQSVPKLSVTQLVSTIKSITARELFRLHPKIKRQLWGGNIWTSGYYANTVGQYGNEKVIQQYVQSQGKRYKQIFTQQLSLFE